MTSMPFSPHDIVLHPGQFGRDLSILLRGAVVFPQLELPEAHHEVGGGGGGGLARTSPAPVSMHESWPIGPERGA
jgi:hypothetical protein